MTSLNAKDHSLAASYSEKTAKGDSAAHFYFPTLRQLTVSPPVCHLKQLLTFNQNARPCRSDLQLWPAWRITRSCLTGQDHRTAISSAGHLIIRRHMTLADRKDTRKDRPSPAGRPDRRTSNEERANPVLQRSHVL